MWAMTNLNRRSKVFKKLPRSRPPNEKLYLFVADACTDSQNYHLGLKIVDAGLQNLPQSARLHYQRGTFLAHLDQMDIARRISKLPAKLEPGSNIAFIVQAQENLFAGNISESIRIAREGIANHHQTAALLTILGQALFRSGLTPGQREFAETKAALKNLSQPAPMTLEYKLISGRLYLMENRSMTRSHIWKSRGVSNPITHLHIRTWRRLTGGTEILNKHNRC